MAGNALRAGIQVEGLRELLQAFNRMPKEANEAIRAESLVLAERLSTAAAAAANAEGRQGPLLAGTVRPRRDRVVSITAGGSTRVGRNQTPAYRLLFGSEFGSNRYRQFGKPHAGRRGYWLFPTVERNAADIAAAWGRAADRVVRDFS